MLGFLVKRLNSRSEVVACLRGAKSVAFTADAAQIDHKFRVFLGIVDHLAGRVLALSLSLEGRAWIALN